MVFLMKMVFAIELLKHTNNQYGIVQLQNLCVGFILNQLRFVHVLVERWPLVLEALLSIDKPNQRQSI